MHEVTSSIKKSNNEAYKKIKSRRRRRGEGIGGSIEASDKAN